MSALSFDTLLPALVSFTAALGLLWLAVWLATQGLQRWGAGTDTGAGATGIVLWANRLSWFLRQATATASFIVAFLIMLYGVGIRGLPQLTWDQLSGWVRGSGLSLLFILGSALVLIRTTAIAIRSLPGFLVPARLSLAERLDRRKRVETRGRPAGRAHTCGRRRACRSRRLMLGNAPPARQVAHQCLDLPNDL